MQGQLPSRPDNPSRTLIGSSAVLAADAEFAEPSGGDLAGAPGAGCGAAETQRRGPGATRLSY